MTASTVKLAGDVAVLLAGHALDAPAADAIRADLERDPDSLDRHAEAVYHVRHHAIEAALRMLREMEARLDTEAHRSADPAMARRIADQLDLVRTLYAELIRP